MKIRGKLILSFSVLIIIILSVLGLIIYKTFSDSIDRLEDQIYSKKVSEISLRLDAVINDCANDCKLAAAELIAERAIAPTGKIEQPIAQKLVAGHMRENKFLSSVYLVSPDGQKIVTGSHVSGLSPAEFKTLIVKTGGSFSKDPFIIKAADRLLLVNPIFHKGFSKNPYLLVCEMDIKAFSKIILPDMKGEAALFVASKNGVPFLKVYSKKESFTSLDIKDVLGTTRATNGPKSTMSVAGNFHAFSSLLESVGWDLTYVVPNATYLSDVITLKNRIIVAIVVIFWLSIWVVLIISYNISKHLEMLSKAAKDMMALNYETPIKVSQTNDEIQDLANSFELMRLRIKDLVLKDHLTDIYNRRFLVQFLESEVTKARRSKDGLSVLMIDIDNFKKINDTYGHDCGDKVLIAIGQALKSMIRDYEIVARYGGEEFVVVLPSIDPQQAYLAAERLRKGIESSEMMDNAAVKVTVSIGVASYIKDALDSPEELINAADIALYQAKEAGRNKTVVYNLQKFRLAQ